MRDLIFAHLAVVWPLF